MLQGSLLTEINAAGKALITAYTVEGYVSETRFCQKALGADNDVVPLFNFSRSPDGRILSQASGTGLTEDYQYNQRTRHGILHIISRTHGILSDLLYEYDPRMRQRQQIRGIAACSLMVSAPSHTICFTG